MTISEKLEEMELTKLFIKSQEDNFDKDSEVLALYNAERKRLYGEGQTIEFLDFSQSHAMKTLIKSEVFDRHYNPYK